MRQKKIVIMGLANSGVSTTRKKFMDEHWVPPREERYNATIHFEKHTRVLHDTKFTIYDLGGQTIFLDHFIGEIAEEIFGGIDSLIFIVNVIEIRDIARAKYYFDRALDRTESYNPKASVFVFLHKIDLLPRALKEEACQTSTEFLLKGISREIRVYETSIFTNSSTKAVEAVYRENIPIFDEKLTLETEEIDHDKEEDEMLALSLREALKIFQGKDFSPKYEKVSFSLIVSYFQHGTKPTPIICYPEKLKDAETLITWLAERSFSLLGILDPKKDIHFTFRSQVGKERCTIFCYGFAFPQLESPDGKESYTISFIIRQPYDDTLTTFKGGVLGKFRLIREFIRNKADITIIQTAMKNVLDFYTLALYPRIELFDFPKKIEEKEDQSPKKIS